MIIVGGINEVYAGLAPVTNTEKRAPAEAGALERYSNQYCEVMPKYSSRVRPSRVSF